jgi:hypothetical protein
MAKFHDDAEHEKVYHTFECAHIRSMRARHGWPTGIKLTTNEDVMEEGDESSKQQTGILCVLRVCEQSTG